MFKIVFYTKNIQKISLILFWKRMEMYDAELSKIKYQHIKYQ